MGDKLELNMQARLQWNKVARTRRDIPSSAVLYCCFSASVHIAFSHFGINVNFDSGPLLVAVVEHWDL